MYKYILMLFFALGLMACNNDTTETQEQEEVYKFDAQAAEKQYQSIKTAVKEGKSSRSLKQKLREEIGLNRFDGQDIEISEAQLWYEGTTIKAIDAGFFDGAPIGVKHWFCDAGVPVAVEVAGYATDEEGLLIEKAKYVVLLDPKENQDSIINSTVELSAEQQSAIFAENRKEWDKLKALAEKYKPKAE
jgi:hypothetical protein